MGIYQYLLDVPKQSLFNYIAIGIIIIGYVSRIVQPTFIFVIAVIVALVFIYFFNDKRKSQLGSYNEELEYRMKMIQPATKYFYTDPDVINIFYNIKEFRNYNQDAYERAVKSTDTILSLHEDVIKGVMICDEYLNEARRHLKIALNSLQSIIFKMPNSPKMYKGSKPDPLLKKYHDALKILHLILRRHIDEIFNVCKKQTANEEITINTKFSENEGPEAYQPEFQNLIDKQISDGLRYEFY
jgi:hypothetical protein